ncbi:TadE/TadG family type IV pilus assembly protein [Methylobacterium gnaphalii]|uniref:TadE-like domain-containing protein n=1 Tax=Methylobacterium gnaphalii TaxID=1010610 RepID=A0A512JLC1_9HYPH|nr:TadE/TadG family type IV pilus assembly protein [Methylobacterium gnaphalii]GEP10750.1 hypothetical protein MGN01_25950 [Methylobacterium gnaphalii]GJD67378.1 hypothetical protein MMMDOFMJ_0293 [Methylobacterium gnaphalii]GLS49290.1 hypothetical protein GCM10007885_21380 [Methylobacterium gnaphalii]
MRNPFKCFRREQSGVASVEFALLSSVLLLILMGGFDLVYMVSAKRDADRASVLIARAMTSCSASSCVQDFIQSYLPREANALIRYPNASVDLYGIQYVGGQLKTCFGKDDSPLSDSAVIALAKTIMRDKDFGAAVTLTTTYTSILPKFLVGYISSAGASYSRYTVDVMRNNSGTTSGSTC